MKQELINKLPYDIINKIISYTYNVQPKELLEDIESYCNTKNILCNLVESKYSRYSWFTYSENCINYLSIELHQYLMNLINNKFKNIDNDLIHYGYYKLVRSGKTRINYFWGLLTPEERNGFLVNELISI